MSVKKELTKFSEMDIWSMMLFVLFRVKDVPEYSSLSELVYLLDKKNFLKLCQYLGGTTIRIPRVEEMEELLYAMLLYQYVNIEKMPIEDAIKLVDKDVMPKGLLMDAYNKVKAVLEDYDFTPRGK